jgi:hypothetical protein
LFHTLEQMQLESTQAQVASLSAVSQQHVEAILTSSADPILSGSHLPVLAAASFAIDCRLFQLYLHPSATSGAADRELPIGGVLLSKPVDRASRCALRADMERRVLGTLLAVLQRRQELPLMPPNFQWPVVYVPLDNPRTASPAEQAEDELRKSASVTANLASLTVVTLGQGRIGFRQFRALILQVRGWGSKCAHANKLS